MIRYTRDTESWTVEAVECEKRGWPHLDSKGRQQYDNTYFDTDGQAWDSLCREALAYASLSSRDVEECRKRLTKAIEDAAEAARAVTLSHNGRETFEQSAPKGTPQ